MRGEKGFLHRSLDPLLLFVVGLLTIPAFLFQQHLVVKIAQAFLFAGLAALAGKKIKWLYFVIMVGSITIFHLSTPLGRILYEIGPIRITWGALRLGLLKGFTIVGLVFLSLGTISRDLRLPGSLGGLIGRLFYYFERVLDTKGRVEAKNLIPSLDRILEELFPPGVGAENLGRAVAARSEEGGPEATASAVSATSDPDEGAEARRRTSPVGLAAAVTIVLVNWSLLLI